MPPPVDSQSISTPLGKEANVAGVRPVKKILLKWPPPSSKPSPPPSPTPSKISGLIWPPPSSLSSNLSSLPQPKKLQSNAITASQSGQKSEEKTMRPPVSSMPPTKTTLLSTPPPKSPIEQSSHTQQFTTPSTINQSLVPKTEFSENQPPGMLQLPSQDEAQKPHLPHLSKIRISSFMTSGKTNEKSQELNPNILDIDENWSLMKANPLQQDPLVEPPNFQQSPPTPSAAESPPRSHLSSVSSASGSPSGSPRGTNRSISPSLSLESENPPAASVSDTFDGDKNSSIHEPISFDFQPISTSNDHELDNPRTIIDNAGPPNLERISNIQKSWGRLGIQTNQPSSRLSGIYTNKLATPGEFALPTFAIPGEENHSDDDPIIDNNTMSASKVSNGIQNAAYQANSDEEEDGDDSETISSQESIDKHSIDSDSDIQQGDTIQSPPSGVTFGENADRGQGGTLNRKQSSKKQTAFWDIFSSESADNVSEEEIQCWNKCFVITRVFFLILLFFIVLICASVAKVSFLLMTSNIFPQTYSNKTAIKTMFGLLKYDLKNTEVSWIWALNVTIAAPYLFAFFKYFWRLCFRKTGPLQCLPLLLAICTETLHSIGLSVFVFLILPSFDPISASLICFNVGVIPGIFKIFYPARIRKYAEESNLICARLINILALIFQICSIGLWCYYIYVNSGNEKNWPLIIIIIVAPILISLSWWDNFVPRGKKESTGFPKLKRVLGHGKTKIGILISLWKMIMAIVIMPSAIFGTICNNGTTCVKAIFFQSDENPQVSSPIGYSQLVDNDTIEGCKKYIPFLIAILNIVCNGLVFKTAKTACKIVAHKIGYALPVALATPVSIGLLLGFFADTSFRNIHESCYLHFPKWTDNSEIFKVEELFKDTDKLYLLTIIAGVLGYLSLYLITNHVWSPGKERLASTDKLFVKALYCSVLLDQSMLLNRRRCDDEFASNEEKKKKKDIVSAIPEIPDDPDWNPSEDWSFLRKDDTPMIYMCATMWHETENEMTQILKSIFRMDEDQCTRRNMQLFLGIKDPDYYEFEAHIFFDDAFEKHTDDEYEYNVNGYVKMLINVIDLAASSVHNDAMKIPPPTKVPTPYGGRLIWRLPGGNRIIAHLKDKTKIRHRKRWSQVMYMYYFLGHRLTQLKCSRRRKEKISQNTFLLALDGDVDFQPIAVQLLVDRMKKNPSVGAACGRIHPIGSGPMVWYQKFEYAISHWLQKATENMLGCVLCSPGCFSLFRGSSLMDDNVMHRYTTNPTEALHYVQYDQGEDRWLCTLLLQQGYKVEYVAASDALTYAPEGFYEFYNQRRRWSPSTMANIMDLLMDWKNVTKKNEDISMLYIGYQMFLMVSSILTPGTIFLMVLGAISTGFPTIPAWGAFILNIIPVAIMVILCFTAKSETQLAYSAILSAIYTLLMMIVLIGLLKEAASAKFCSVTTIFLLFVAGVFVVSAILHPQEFFCVMHGVLYFLAIPSMSMLLMIYSLGNLHVVSWGTRETKQPTTPQKQQHTAKGGTGSKVKDWLQSLGGDVPVDSSDYDYACGGLFRCICFPQSQRSAEDNKFRIILERLEEMEQKMTEYSRVSTAQDASLIMDEYRQNENKDEKHFSESAGLFEGAGERNNPLYEEPKQQKRDELKNPYWVLDEDLKEGPQDFLPNDELEFWQPFIDKYLYPLESNKKKEEAIQNELMELRNKVCLGFILINALFVTILFVLTVVDASDKGSLSITLPCENPTTPTGKGYIEPISFAFTLIFGVLLLLQFIFMILHRIATLVHILASTEIKAKKRFAFGKFWGNDDDDESIGVDEGLKLVRDMQTAKDDDTQSIMSEASTISDDESINSTLKHRNGKQLWKKLAKRRIDMQQQTLSKTFIKNFEKLQDVVTSDDAASTMATAEGSNLDRSIRDGKMSIAQNRFKHFARPSLQTIVKMSQNENSKHEIQRRGTQIKRNEEEKRKRRLKDVASKLILQKKLQGGQGGMMNVAKLALMKKREEDESQYQTIPEEVDEDVTETKVKAIVHSSSSDSSIPDENSEEHKIDVSDKLDKQEASSLKNVDILF